MIVFFHISYCFLSRLLFFLFLIKKSYFLEKANVYSHPDKKLKRTLSKSIIKVNFITIDENLLLKQFSLAKLISLLC